MTEIAAQELFLPAGSPAGIAVSTAILVLFAVALADLLITAGRLVREGLLLRRARAALAQLAAPSAPPSADELAAALALPPGSFLGRRVAGVVRLRQAGLGPRELLRPPDGERLAGYGALARYIGAILILLGLLGTVLGLSFALLKIHAALGSVGDVAALDELTAALGQTLLGMRTAFATTLAGLVTALLLSAGNFVVQRRLSRLAAAIEELVAGELVPLLVRAEPEAEEASRSFARTLTDAAQELGRLQETITAAAGRYDEASQAIAGAAAGFGGSVAGFGHSVTEAAGNQQAFSDLLRQTGEALRALEATTAGQLGELRSWLGELRQLLEARLADVAGQAEANHALLAEIRGLAVGFRSAASAMQEEVQRVSQLALGQLEGTVSGLLEKLGKQHQAAVRSQLEASREAYEAMLQRHLEQLETAGEENRRAAVDLVAAQQGTLGAFSDLVVDLRQQIAPLFDRPDPAAAIESALAGNQALLGDLRRLADGFQQAAVDARGQLQAAVEMALAELGRGVESLLAGLHRQGFQELTSQLGEHRQGFEAALTRHREEVEGLAARHRGALAELVEAQRTTLAAFTDLVADVHANLNALWGSAPWGSAPWESTTREGSAAWGGPPADDNGRGAAPGERRP